MNAEGRQSVRALMRRYIATETKEGLFHALAFARVLADDSAAFVGVINGFPVCEVHDDGQHLVDGRNIRLWDISDEAVLSECDRLRARI